MHGLLSALRMKTVALICIAMLSAGATAADVAGSVSFVIGDASLIGADGKATPVARGDAVNAGLTLATGATGHIHVRMIDGAFISVRPQSRLRIEDYRYDAATPANNRIKLVLEQGVARSITGRAGEASKENYRLNTPLAAIGIRGTDFVVQASADITRVTVQSGAVVMSPLSADCLASAIGPCNSAATRVLTAAMRNAYLELRSRSEVPLLVPAEKALESPNLLAPPRPEEPKVSTDRQSKAPAGVEPRDAVRQAAADVIKTRVDASQVPPPTAVVEPPTVVVVEPLLPPVVVIAAPPKFWGRWTDSGRPLLEGVPVDAEPVLLLDNQILFGENGRRNNFALPGSGTAAFKLAGSDAVIVNGSSTGLATVSGGSLAFDFSARRFDTALTVNSTGNAPVAIQSSGRVFADTGTFVNDDNTTGTKVLGALSKDSDQAGYLFQRILPSGTRIEGSTRWVR